MASQSDIINSLQNSGEIARHYSQLLGFIPQSFSGTVRSLIIDMREGLLQASPRSTFQIGRLLKAPTVLSSIYYATRSFLPNNLSKERPITPLEMVRLYDPLSLASLLALSYLYRRARRICDQDEWKFISQPWQRNLEIGALIGLRAKEIGMSYGILSGSMLFVAFSTLLANDKKKFTEYRRHLKKYSKDIDPEYERKQWGCSSAQVAANILLSMGFGVNLSAAIAASYLVDFKTAKPKDSMVKRFYTARACIIELYKNLSLPSLLKQSEGNYNDTLNRIGQVIEKGSLYNWLERNKSEVGDGLTPEIIIIDREPTTTQNEIRTEKDQLDYQTLPEDIKNTLSEAEFYPYKNNTVEEIRVILGLDNAINENVSF